MTDARLDVAHVATPFDATAHGLTQDATLHFRGAAKTNLVTIAGPDHVLATTGRDVGMASGAALAL